MYLYTHSHHRSTTTTFLVIWKIFTWLTISSGSGLCSHALKGWEREREREMECDRVEVIEWWITPFKLETEIKPSYVTKQAIMSTLKHQLAIGNFHLLTSHWCLHLLCLRYTLTMVYSMSMTSFSSSLKRYALNSCSHLQTSHTNIDTHTHTSVLIWLSHIPVPAQGIQEES